MSLKGTVSRVKAPRDNRNWTEKVSQTTHATTSQNSRALSLFLILTAHGWTDADADVLLLLILAAVQEFPPPLTLYTATAAFRPSLLCT